MLSEMKRTFTNKLTSKFSGLFSFFPTSYNTLSPVIFFGSVPWKVPQKLPLWTFHLEKIWWATRPFIWEFLPAFHVTLQWFFIKILEFFFKFRNCHKILAFWFKNLEFSIPNILPLFLSTIKLLANLIFATLKSLLIKINVELKMKWRSWCF